MATISLRRQQPTPVVTAPPATCTRSDSWSTIQSNMTPATSASARTPQNTQSAPQVVLEATPLYLQMPSATYAPPPPPPPPPPPFPPPPKRDKSFSKKRSSSSQISCVILESTPKNTNVDKMKKNKRKNSTQQQQQHQDQRDSNDGTCSSEGSSTHSKSKLSALEMDRDDILLATSTDSAGGTSWMRRIAWFRARKRGKEDGDSLDYTSPRDGESIAVYYGSAMETDPPELRSSSSSNPQRSGPIHNIPITALSLHQLEHQQHQQSPLPQHHHLSDKVHGDAVPPPASNISLKETSSFQRIASWLTRSSINSPTVRDRDEDSLADFQDTDWTPPDSSYGAAIPVGGWIPKNVRRLIEWTLIGFVIGTVGYFVVATSIRISDGSAPSEKSKAYSHLDLDDDRYIEYSSNVYKKYDDDYYGNGKKNSSFVDDDYYTADDDMYGYNSKKSHDDYYYRKKNRNYNYYGYNGKYQNDDDDNYYSYQHDDNSNHNGYF